MKTKAKSVKYYIIRFSPNGTLDIFNKMKSAIWYKSLDTAQKQKRAEWFNLLSSAQKQKTAEWYKSMNPGEKEKLFSGRAE